MQENITKGEDGYNPYLNKSETQKGNDLEANIQSQIHHPHNQFLPIQAPSFQSSASSYHSSHSAYRPDIDGLRAIAVTMVVIFHGWHYSLSGGYIGVDIFFVISGYLITQILIKQNSKSDIKFSHYIYTFYNRRVKRIYPALIVLLIFVLVFGSLNLQKTNLQIMAKTTAASTVFSANLYILYQKSGYWEFDSKSNPLLHLWSLGVEQQFYIVWPVVLYLLFYRSKNSGSIFRSIFTVKRQNVMTCLIVFTLVSMMINTTIVENNQKLDFYFPLCRFWQMSVGGILAYKYHPKPQVEKQLEEEMEFKPKSISILQSLKLNNFYVINIISASALVTLILTAFFLRERSPYPGWLALIPTLSTACIIQCGHPSSYSLSLVNRYALSNRPMLFIGKISYSFYLWHWPLLVFSRLKYPYGSPAILAQTYVVVTIALVLSILSYYFVQNTVRFRKQKIVFVALLVAMGIIGMSALIINYKSAEIAPPSAPEQYDANDPIWQQYFKDMLPTEYDMVYINQDGSKSNGINTNKKIPNLSKNRNRLYPTVQKLRLPNTFPWTMHIFEQINSSSKFYRSKQQRPQQLRHYQVINPGRDKLVLLYGDSHAHFTSFRFGKLYKDAAAQNRLDKLPTMVFITLVGRILVPSEQNYKFFLDWVEQFKPDKILFVYYWYSWYYHGFRPDDKTNRFQQKYFYVNVPYFIKILQNLTKNNVNVTVVTWQPYGDQYNPYYMTDQTGVIEQRVKPMNHSKFKFDNAGVIYYLENQLKKTGANIIDYSDHMCWNDICQVVSSKGYKILYDKDHITYQIAKDWLTVVDFFIQS